MNEGNVYHANEILGKIHWVETILKLVLEILYKITDALIILDLLQLFCVVFLLKQLEIRITIDTRVSIRDQVQSNIEERDKLDQ